MNVAPSLLLAVSVAAFLIGRTTDPEIPPFTSITPVQPARAPAVPDIQLDLANARRGFVSAHLHTPEPAAEAQDPSPQQMALSAPPLQPGPPPPRAPTPVEIAARIGAEVSAIVYGVAGPELMLIDQHSKARRTLMPGNLYGSGWRFAGVQNGEILIRRGRATERIPIGIAGSNATVIALPAAPSVTAQFGATTNENGNNQGVGALGTIPPRRRMLRRGGRLKAAGGI